MRLRNLPAQLNVFLLSEVFGGSILISLPVLEIGGCTMPTDLLVKSPKNY